jgi:hypothetical protein
MSEPRLRLDKALIYESKIPHPYKKDVEVNVNGFRQEDMYWDGSIHTRFLMEYWTQPILLKKELCNNPSYVKSTHLMPCIRVYGVKDPSEFEADSFVEERYMYWDRMTLEGERPLPYVWPCSKKRTIVNAKAVADSYEIGDTSRMWGYIQTIYTLEPRWGTHNPTKMVDVTKAMAPGVSYNPSMLNQLTEDLMDSLIDKADNHVYYKLPLYCHGRMVSGYRPDVYPKLGEVTDLDTNTVGYQDLAVVSDRNPIEPLNLDKLTAKQFNSIPITD